MIGKIYDQYSLLNGRKLLEAFIDLYVDSHINKCDNADCKKELL